MFIYTPYRLLAGNLRVACWESLMVAVANIYNIGVGLRRCSFRLFGQYESLNTWNE